jgi:PAS domain S-box-containing protein
MAAKDDEEEERLRSAAFQNAQSILLARRRAEDALRKQSEWLRTTLSSIGDAVICTDADGQVMFMNGMAESLTGWPQADAIGQPLPEIFRIVDQATRHPIEDPVTPALREGSVVRRVEHPVLIARDRTERVIDDSAAPIRDDSGTAVGVVLVFRDIAEREQAEVVRARLASIVESSQDAIVSKTLDGVILTWNAGAERLFGYTLAEAVGRPITFLIPPERQGEEREILAKIGRGEPVEHFDTERLTKQGRKVAISLTVSPVRDGAGRVIGASKIARDITEQKRAQWLLREGDRRKDEFLALLAHELRNPLAPIRNAVGILRAKGPKLPELDWARDVIERQVNQMSRLIDDLVDVSRITRGTIELRIQRVELSAVVSDAIETSQPLVEKRGHQLTVELPPEAVHLDADPTRLAQILLNLLNNAAKYTKHGGRIWLTAERADEQVVVRVKDTGVGIPTNMLSRIFEMFTQVERSLAHSEGGLGIGLMLVQRLVELHGGTVEAHSDGPDQGSEFVVRLPVVGEA